MNNPYEIEGPAVISFSGGRTSGYMLRNILDVGLAPDVHVVFANTGKEREETLVFVNTVSREWGVDIVWLERHGDGHPVEVAFTSAARNGEPFDAIIGKRGYAPGPMSRFCSTELKTLTIDKWMRGQGYPKYWGNVVGIRGDEQRRAAKMLEGGQRRGWEVVLPLYERGVIERDVMEFWDSQTFDLGITSMQGNCDLCFLKSRSKLVNLIRDEPERAEWWIRHEVITQSVFRRDRANYSEMVAQRDLFKDSSESEIDIIECACTD